MQSVKLKFRLSHSLAELFSFTLSALGATGVVSVDKEEFSALYDTCKATLYAADEYIESLEEGAVIEAYFKPSEEWSSIDEDKLLELADPQDYAGEIYENLKTSPHSLKDLLAYLEIELQKYSKELGGSYCYLGAELVADEDWAETWKEFYTPLALSPRLTVSPSWLAYQAQRPEERVIEIDPGSAFGTGYHESTELCLRALDLLALHEPEFFKSARILDLGTGSGILAIAAAKLGARQLELIDVDATAIEVARKNCHKNQVLAEPSQGRSLTFKVAELTDTEGRYDLIMANLIAQLHIDLSAVYATKLKPQAYLILSGIIDWKLEEVLNALKQSSLELEEMQMKNDWWTLIYRQVENV